VKRFVFLIHPRDGKDVGRVKRLLWTKILPEKIVEKILFRLPPVICSRFNVFNKTEGFLVAVPLTARQMLGLPLEFVRKRILEAALFAQNKLGAELIGLGALISSMTRKGIWLSKRAEIEVPVTHGDSYAVGVTIEAIEKITSLVGNSVIGIVGAYGLIGSALARLLHKKSLELVLVGRNEVKLKRLEKELKKINSQNRPVISKWIVDINKADIVITTTNASDAILKPEYLKPNAIIYDIAQPRNVSFQLLKERPDVIYIDGGLANINGINLGFKMGTPQGATFSCLAETILQALEDDKESHVGEISLGFVKEVRYRAEKYGFSHAEFTCFGKPIPIPNEEKPKILTYLEVKNLEAKKTIS